MSESHIVDFEPNPWLLPALEIHSRNITYTRLHVRIFIIDNHRQTSGLGMIFSWTISCGRS